MEFEWDEKKNDINFKKHGLRFELTKYIFKNPIYRIIDDRNDYGEIRMIGIGQFDGRTFITVFTYRNNKIRIISLRKANKKEKSLYNKFIT